MLTMLVCGLAAWYHVDCVQFNFWNDNPMVLRDDSGIFFEAMSEIPMKNLGIMDIFATKQHDACGNSAMGHEYQRFHQKRFDMAFCNYGL